jgi:DNA mismatch repair protein MSH5
VPADLSSSHRGAHRGPFAATSVDTPSNDRDDAEESDDTLIEIVMSVDMTPRGTVGCCYYVAKDEKLYFMEDIQCGDVDVIDCRELFLTQHQGFLLTNSQ